MSSTVERAKSLLSGWQYPRMSPEKEAAFARYGRERFCGAAPSSPALCVVGSLLWWPVDYVIYRDLPQYIGPTETWRIALSLMGVVYLLLTRFERIRAYDYILLMASGLILGATMGWTSGSWPAQSARSFISLYAGAGDDAHAAPVLQAARADVGVRRVDSGRISFALPSICFVSRLAIGIQLLRLRDRHQRGVRSHVVRLLPRSNFCQAALLAENNALLEERVTERMHELRELLSRLETTREEERTRIARRDPRRARPSSSPRCASRSRSPRNASTASRPPRARSSARCARCSIK